MAEILVLGCLVVVCLGFFFVVLQVLKSKSKLLQLSAKDLQDEITIRKRTEELDQTIKNLQAEVMARKRAENELAKRAEELASSNKELDRFVLIASHDLQEPLRRAKNYAQLLEQRYKGRLDEKADKFIEYMVDGVERMQNLVRDLLAYSRLGKADLPFERVDLMKVARSAMQDLEAVIQENNATITYGDLPVVMANPAQIEQLMQNLLTNALKFRGDAPPVIGIIAEKKQHEWQVAVKDNGIGILPEYSEKIFQIFERLHDRKEYSGTGIGLAICKKIVERHGGRIWMRSVVGEGSIFYFTLPLRSTVGEPVTPTYA